MFDTLKYSKDLETAGVPRDQAEAHVRIFAEIIEASLATKQDLRELEYRLTIKLSAVLGTIVMVGIAVATAIAKLF